MNSRFILNTPTCTLSCPSPPQPFPGYSDPLGVLKTPGFRLLIRRENAEVHLRLKSSLHTQYLHPFYAFQTLIGYRRAPIIQLVLSKGRSCSSQNSPPTLSSYKYISTNLYHLFHGSNLWEENEVFTCSYHHRWVGGISSLPRGFRCGWEKKGPQSHRQGNVSSIQCTFVLSCLCRNLPLCMWIMPL